jgi:hypothetical protein
VSQSILLSHVRDHLSIPRGFCFSPKWCHTL